MLVLRNIASEGTAGIRLLDLARRAELPRPTVHRIVKALVAQGLLAQDPITKRYCLGRLIYEFGLAAPVPVRRIDRMRPFLQRLAHLTEDTAYLVMRSDDEVVCVNIEEGRYPIRARTFEVGARRPLGVGAAGLALLATMADADVDAYLTRNSESLKRYGLSAAEMRHRVDAARRHGAISHGTITEGVSGIACAIPCIDGVSQLAVSVAAISERMDSHRLTRIGKNLRLTARQIASIGIS